MPVRGIGRHSATHQPGGSDSISPLTGDLDFGNNFAVSISRVGIRTSNPEAALDVRGRQDIKLPDPNDFLRFLDSDTGDIYTFRISSTGRLYLQVYDNSAATIRYMQYWDPTNGNVGIKTETPGYDLDVKGDIHCTGKLTSDGGNDPAYVLYDYQTRTSLIELVKKEVPPSKLGGAVLFFNGEKQSLELFLPLKGEFRSLNGELLEKTDPITKTFEVEKRYYFDEEDGKVKSYEVKKYPSKYKLKKGVILDTETGKFKKIMRRKVKKIIDGREEMVEVEEEIEITKEEAIEEVTYAREEK